MLPHCNQIFHKLVARAQVFWKYSLDFQGINPENSGRLPEEFMPEVPYVNL